MGVIRRRGAVISRGLVLIALSCGLAAASLPRVAAWVAAWPGEGALARLRDGQNIDDDAFALIRRSRERAMSLRPSAQFGTDLGLVELRRLDGRRAVRAERDLPEIRAQLRESLSLGPADPYAWTGLAAVEEGLALSSAEQALRMAFLTGLYERPLAASRLAVLLRTDRVAHLDDLAARQLRWAWTFDARSVARIAEQADAIEELRRALRER